jgi:hypothetical protein
MHNISEIDSSLRPEYKKINKFVDIGVILYLFLMVTKFIGRGNVKWRGYVFISDDRLAGCDFREFYNYALGYFQNGVALKFWIYPPFSTYYLFPHTFLNETNAYLLHSIVWIICFYCSFKISLKCFFADSNLFYVFLLLSVIIFFYSYPAMFSIERGNSDVVALFFITLFIYFYKIERIFYSVIFLVLATQLKIYPLCLAFIFLNKKHLKHFLMFGVLNFILLFSMGFKVLTNFLASLTSIGAAPYVWPGNHSLHSFLEILKMNFSLNRLSVFVVGIFFLAVILTCWVSSIFEYNLKRTDRGFINFVLNSLLVACFVIPVSHDYKLIILFPILFISFLYKCLNENLDYRKLLLDIILISGLMFSLSMGFYFYNTKFLILFLILINANYQNFKVYYGILSRKLSTVLKF